MKCTVGPVIGEVTDATARILLECNADGEVSLTLTSENGKDIQTESQVLSKGRPKLYKFQKLLPGTRYTVTTEDTKIVKSSFKTLPHGGFSLEKFKKSGRGPRFGFVSGNNVYATRERDTTRKSICLWRDLASSVKHFDYLLHLGDNVYKESDVHRKTQEDKWFTALEHIKRDGEFYEHKWEAKKEEIREIFRSAYRDTWGNGATRTVLANVPNLMIYAENDIAQNWVSRPESQKGSVQWFVMMQVFYVLGEYHTQLHKDFYEASPNDMSYHFHSLGDIGFYFQDTVGCKTLHKDADKLPMLGQRQWSDLKQALSASGIFNKSKFLFVLTPRPVFFLDEAQTTNIAKIKDNSFRNMWMNEPHVPEATDLLDDLVSWKEAVDGRDVLVVGGSASQGGWTSIDVDSGLGTSLKQLTTGTVASNPTGTKLNVSGQTQCVSKMASKHGGCYSFDHFGWTKQRNYAVVEMMKDSRGNASYVGHLVEASDFLIEEKGSYDARFDSEGYREAGCGPVCSGCCIS